MYKKGNEKGGQVSLPCIWHMGVIWGISTYWIWWEHSTAMSPHMSHSLQQPKRQFRKASHCTKIMSSKYPFSCFTARQSSGVVFLKIVVVASRCARFQASKCLFDLGLRSPVSVGLAYTRDEVKAHESHRPHSRNERVSPELPMWLLIFVARRRWMVGDGC